MGIKFKHGHQFWLKNGAELDYIYYDFQVRAKEIKRELHPDAGGDLESFQDFSADCDWVVKCFARHGIGDVPSSHQVVEEKEQQELRRYPLVLLRASQYYARNKEQVKARRKIKKEKDADTKRHQISGVRSPQ